MLRLFHALVLLAQAAESTFDVAICEGPNPQSLQCNRRRAISVESASWSVDQSTDHCVSNASRSTSGPNCLHDDVGTLELAKAICNGNSQCQLYASSDHFGNPCPNISDLPPKSLNVRYSCLDNPFRASFRLRGIKAECPCCFQCLKITVLFDMGLRESILMVILIVLVLLHFVTIGFLIVFLKDKMSNTMTAVEQEFAYRQAMKQLGSLTASRQMSREPGYMQKPGFAFAAPMKGRPQPSKRAVSAAAGPATGAGGHRYSMIVPIENQFTQGNSRTRQEK